MSDQSLSALVNELSKLEKEKVEKIERILTILLRMDTRSLEIIWKTAIALIKYKK